MCVSVCVCVCVCVCVVVFCCRNITTGINHVVKQVSLFFFFFFFPLCSTDLRCGREVTTKLVDNCVNQFFNTCMVNNTCRELPFFNKTFCSSPKNAMLCGEFCRRGGPRLLSKCEPSQMAICVRRLANVLV